MFRFITIIAWCGAAVSTFFYLVTWFLAYAYSKDDIAKLKDLAMGRTRTFPHMKWFIAAVICWAWIISTWGMK